MYYYSTYWLVFIGFLLTLFANFYVNHTYKKYSKYQARCRMSGREVAEYIIRRNSAPVSVNRTSGELTDHYDPRNEVVNLSDSTYGKSSVSAIAVAAHECGHVMQHETGYFPLKFRSALVPLANFGSNAGIWIVMLSILLGLSNTLVNIGIFLFSFGVLFQLVTLPVEFDASKRGLRMLQDYSILQPDEMRMAKKVLRAAAMTYVAAAASSVLQLIRLLLLRGRRN